MLLLDIQRTARYLSGPVFALVGRFHTSLWVVVVGSSVARIKCVAKYELLAGLISLKSYFFKARLSFK